MSETYGGQPDWQQTPSPAPAPGPGYSAAAPQPYPQAAPPAQQYPPTTPPAQPYPPAQGYAASQPYPPAQPYPQAYAPAQPYPVAYPTAPVKHSSALGVISLLIMVAATVASVVGVVMMADIINQLAMTTQSTSFDQDQIQQQFTLPGVIVNVAGLIGFICWILAIVATATNRGRPAGVAGIILGVLAPIGVWSYFFFAVYQTIQHYQ